MDKKAIRTSLPILISGIVLLMSGCATKEMSDVFPSDAPTMSDIYNKHMEGTNIQGGPIRKNSLKHDYQMRELMRGTLAAFESQEWSEVIRYTNAIIAIEPFNVKALSNRSVALAELGQIDKAIQDANAATYADPNYSIAQNNKAYVYEKAGDYETAKTSYALSCKLGLESSCNDMIRIMKAGYQGIPEKSGMSYVSTGKEPTAPPVINGMIQKQDGKPKAIHASYDQYKTSGINEAVYLTNESNDLNGYVRTSTKELSTLFPELPNPRLVMFVYPHLSSSSDVGVPGYATQFDMYEKTLFALPGELTVKH